jgi:glycerol-3-phosphate dehydrogenase
MRTLLEAFEDLGGRVLTRTRGKDLLFDPDGAVCGLRAETKDGEQLQVDAPAVIVATGGFAGNDELLRRLVPGYDPGHYLYIHGMRFEGDGVIMMEAAGAQIDKNIAIAGGATVW